MWSAAGVKGVAPGREAVAVWPGLEHPLVFSDPVNSKRLGRGVSG
jgi:hypothetical protein